jgi:hypothetical protein
MRADFIRMTSATGGTGALTCSAQTGYPAISEAFTGTRLVDYTIAEYTSSAKTQLSKAEAGVGSYVTSTEVLTRTKILSTWDGTTYLPNPGSATAPTALNFGTTSANVDIMVAPTSMSGVLGLPFTFEATTSVSDGLGSPPLNFSSSGSTPTITSGHAIYWPILLAHTSPISQFTLRTTGTLTGGAPTFDHAIYEVGSNGKPGKRLINFTQLTAIGTTNTNYTSAAIATPVMLQPGWYYAGGLYLAAGATGPASFRGGLLLIAGPQAGLFSASAGQFGPRHVTSQTALNDPATAPDAHTGGTSAIITCYS